MLQYVQWLGKHPGGLTGLGKDDTPENGLYPDIVSLDALINTPDEPAA